MKSQRILVIDDSEIVLERIKMALDSEGYDVVTTTQPVGNARHLRSCDLVIIDFHMPGIDGATVVASLREALVGGTRACHFYLYTSDPNAARAYALHGFDGSFTFKGDEAALVPQVKAAFRRVAMQHLAQKLKTPRG